MTEPVPNRQYLADFSLALVSRSRDYTASRMILNGLPEYFAAVRYWRMLAGKEPYGLLEVLLRRAMLSEMFCMPQTAIRPRLAVPGLQTLYLDALHVLHARIEADDIISCHDAPPFCGARTLAPELADAYRRAFQLIGDSRAGIVFASERAKREFAHTFGSNFRFLKVIALPYADRTNGRTGGRKFQPIPALGEVSGPFRRPATSNAFPAWQQAYVTAWARLLTDG